MRPSLWSLKFNTTLKPLLHAGPYFFRTDGTWLGRHGLFLYQTQIYFLTDNQEGHTPQKSILY